jgi:hypothetical protein
VPLPLTLIVEVNTGVPAHEPLFGPNAVKVIVPVGEIPPLKVALSLTALPTKTDGDTVVVIVSPPAPTTTFSLAAPHRLAAALLFASPL